MALGLALMVGGEWLRRQPLQRAIAAVRADFVPPALTAAGLFAAFANIYAAHELYDLLGAPLAFLGLAAIALLQGPFIALLGMAGGFVPPALIESPTPSAYALFGYLLALVAGSLAVVRYKAWWWLAWVALAGSAVRLALRFGTACARATRSPWRAFFSPSPACFCSCCRARRAHHR
jgi:uncharacterized membrane protein